MKLRSGGRGGASFEGAATEKMEKICSQKGRAKKIRKKEREILITWDINVEKNLGS